MRVEILVPPKARPKKDPEHPCECQNREYHIRHKTGEIFWLVKPGDSVEQDQVICEGEIEKKTFEFRAPCSGQLAEICIEDGEEFTYGDVLGYIETGE